MQLTYHELIRKINQIALEHPELDIKEQPVTLTDPQDSNSYYNVSDLVVEEDGHVSLVST